MYYSNHREERERRWGKEKKRRYLYVDLAICQKRRKMSSLYLPIWKLYSTVNFVFSLSLSVSDELRWVILMWCLVMCSYIRIFLCRQSLRKIFYSPARDIICTHQIMVVSSTYMWTYEVLSCVKLNETIHSFLSYCITLNIYIYTYHQVTPVQ